MYEAQILAKLIKEDVINVNSLIIKRYKELGITEQDVIVLSMFAREEIKHNNLFTPSRMKNKTGLGDDSFFDSLERLQNKGYLKIKSGINNKTGRQVEFFYLDGFYEEIISIYIEEIRKENEKQNQTFEEKISILFEKTFERPMQPSDAEIVRRWAQEGKYTYEEINNEILEAAKLAKYSLKYVDSKLIKNHLSQNQNSEYQNTSKVLQDLSEKWKK